MTIKYADIVWYNVSILTLWHIGFLYALCYVVPTCTWSQLSILWLSLWWLSGLGITAGAHRLWSHKSYNASFVLKIILMCLNSMAFQGSILEWSRDHRIHHKGSETDADPHNAARGFFFAHCGWVMVRKHPQVRIQGKKISIEDLLSDKVVMFQRQYYLPLVVSFCYALPTFLGYLMNIPWAGFWIGGVLRHVWVLHMTWCVNSVAHMWGSRPYAPTINPAESLFVSICAIGEGWHNYHHKYPMDYATGEWGIFSGQWNPTKLFIDICAWLGLASDLKRSRTAADTRRKNRQQNIVKQDWTDGVLDRLFFGRSNDEMFH